MTLTGPGQRLMIYLEETDRRGRTPVYVEVVEQARRAGLAGATVLKGIEGFGASSRVHHQGRFAIAEDVPVVVVVVDTPERIEAFLPVLRDLGIEGLVVRQPVDVIRYGPDPGRGGSPAR